eukprot:CAMPEP_0117760672 /NCGR_PEP_ID=MMETSP0947-20121206/16779_1 /TAXON_ID=44440 /ORGANISM="Chattonella subsalsa, Strain CCMP2191" /LENGTH=266 /DNA_ID=CAMNT_0005581427 /DNA_START=200 /DNA_END=1000 /DNA_ORIENTATION=-
MNLRMMADEFDPIIDAMNSASSSELPNLVAKEVKKVASPQFFMAIADKADKASTEEDKEKLNKLANEVTQILEELLKVAENQMDKASKVVEAIVVSAAEKDGQFLVPLSAERKQAMKQVVEQFSEELDDNFLSTVSTWMNKAQEDKMDGMVQILQRVLQLYAANALQIGVKSVSGTAPESSVFFDDLLDSDPELWTSLVRKGLMEDKRCTPDSLMGAVQVSIEGTVMQQENGSFSQRVQAEFLGELVEIIKAVQVEMEGGNTSSQQ